MTPVPPARAAAARTRPARGRMPVLALLPASLSAGFGLGLAALALTAPPPVIAPLPPVSAAGAGPVLLATAALDAEPWPALFGEAVPQAEVVEEDAEPLDWIEEEPVSDFDASAYILRGLVVSAEGDEDLALIETDEGLRFLRAGDSLPGGYPVLAILDAGVEVEVDGAPFLLEFGDTPARGPATSRPAPESRADPWADEEEFAMEDDESFDEFDDFTDDIELREPEVLGEAYDTETDTEPSFPAAPRFGLTR